MQATRGLTLLSSKNPTFSDSKRVLCKISNAIRRSNIQWRGRSFAASVPSDSSKSERRQKRVTKDERRAMVESFVDKYRASNAGKYPTTSAAKKQVGGSYYVVKKILQELEYQSKISPLSGASQNSLKIEVPKKESQPLPKVEEVSRAETTIDLKFFEPSLSQVESSTVIISNDFEAKLEKEVPKKEFQPLPKVEEVSSSETTVNLKCYEPSLSKGESSTVIISNDFEAKEKPPVSSFVENEKPLFEEAVNPTTRGDDSNCTKTYSYQMVQESSEVLHTHIEKPQDSGKEAAKSEGSLDLDGLKEEVMQEAGQEALESDKLARDIPGEETKDVVPKRSTLWGNLRSFADGVMKLWRNN
ncbi:hypothetical protein BVC80_645g105 [Macleaya cordata]|uniref:AT3G52170-like helix-turn-helix domain-containing protein n=1 Tax=Macleaya cordata TaxID=56857 RepID=A0A200QJT2_MACCD|nr:hypothetical protein BVC80_645g105 [Macleaya cordata]